MLIGVHVDARAPLASRVRQSHYSCVLAKTHYELAEKRALCKKTSRPPVQMHGQQDQTGFLFLDVSTEILIPDSHSLRRILSWRIKILTDLAQLNYAI